MSNTTFSRRFGIVPGGHDAYPLFSLAGDIGTTKEDIARIKWGLSNLDKLKHPFAWRVHQILEPLFSEQEPSHFEFKKAKENIFTLARAYHLAIMETLATIKT